ncbi:MAG: hypothetical protein K8U57_33885 [Planctomycetes bacterium]|nr:hypothetical protein [Planctomycetota bacterium]
MRRIIAWMPGVFLATLGIALLTTPTMTRAGDINFVEDFALAKDRAAALKQLIPGTEDYYYFHCLHYLNTSQFEKIDVLTGPWHERHGQSARLTEIQTRRMLLTYEKNPEMTLAYLRERLGLQFDHQKETVDAAVNLPVTLDQKLIARDTLRTQSLVQSNLDNFEDIALNWLAANDDLGWQKRRNLLQRLTRPDAVGLPKMVIADLTSEHAGEFGYLPIHKQMTLAQLDDLLKLHPVLLNQSVFVTTYLTKLQPGADENWKRDSKATLAYLERLQKFVDRLDVVHNSLKAHVAFHRLAFDRANGVYDKTRFLAYIALPRQQGYMCKALNERESSRVHPANLNADYLGFTLLPPVGNDETLVRSYLKQFFADDKTSTKEYEPFIDDVWLNHLFAETKIELGIGDPEAWASKLPPETFRSLKDRIDIDFAFTNKTEFAADEAVALDLHVKNVQNLIVKVFEINTKTVYRTRLQEVDTDVNLDGLVANSQRIIKYDDSPLRRQDRKIAFPELNKPGVYVIDLIGSGKSSRALIRKGHLRPLVSTGVAGHNLRIVDEKHQLVTDATVWLAGVEYVSDKEGTITVPFTAEPGRRPIVISRGEFASLDFIEHKPEAYRLTAGIHIDRESLLSQRVAPIMVRAGLFLNDSPVSLKLLEDVRLRVTSIDNNNIPSSTDVPDFKLFEDREAIHEVRVPARLKALDITLTAKVKNVSNGKTIGLVESKAFNLNGIDRTDKIEDLHFARFGQNYVVELLGLMGELKADRPITLSIKHRLFRTPVQVILKTDALGRINLGPLTDIVSVNASGPALIPHTWTLSTDAHTYRQTLHAKAGELIALPYVGTAGKPSREELALFEVRESNIRADKFDSIAIANGQIELRGLAAGDYDLHLKQSNERIRVRVVAGVVQAGHILGSNRDMQLPGLKPVTIQSIATDADGLTIRLRDHSKFARVHIFATRYQPAFDAFGNLSRVRDAELGGVVPGHAESVYLTGRNIGDEYRYVLDRKGQKKYPGNMLERPALLLNPWAIRSTETGEQLAKQGGEFSKGAAILTPEPLPKVPPVTGIIEKDNSGMVIDISPNLDFLADASAVILNVVPDKDGVIKLTAKDVGPHAMIHVVAVDPCGTTARSVTLTEKPAAFADLRLKHGLDPAKHFTQQKLVTVIPKGEAFVVADVVGSRFQMYDSLAKVHGFYSTLSKNPTLTEFAFILNWPKLKPEEKRVLYSQHACHELSFFLSRKDPAFFTEFIKPYLKNKKDKTFLDHYLIGNDLSEFMKPWMHGRLNTVERVLLASRITGESTKTARHLDDMLRVIPRNLDKELFNFDVGLDSSILESNDLLADRIDKLKQDTKELNLPEPKPALTQVDPKAPASDLPAMGQSASGSGMGGVNGPAITGFGLAPGEPRSKTTTFQRHSGIKAKDTPADVELYFSSGHEHRRDVRQLYRKIDPTQEWAENNYYKLRIQQQTADLVPVAEFWRDFAQHDGKSPFLSRHLADASRNFTEMMFALSVLDLPFEAGKHDVKFDAGKMTVSAADQLIAFHEEVRPAGGNGGQIPVLLSQNFYRHGDRFRDQVAMHRVGFRPGDAEDGNEQTDKFITDEFVIQTVYGCQVVVTNPTSSRQKLTMLVQLPLGAIAVQNGQFTKSIPLNLEPYHTQTIDYFFYFPKAGKFPQFPVHIAKNEQFVTAAPAMTFNVVAKPAKTDTTSWSYVSQHGTVGAVLAFLNRENVQALDLEMIAFRMKDRPFFEAVTRLLTERHMYHSTLWSYGLFHGDVPTARQFLLHADGLVAECGGPIDSPLLTVDPVARGQYEHLEYKPLVNARAHSLGNRRQIVNDAVLHQYHSFMKTLTYSKELDDTALLGTVYYLLLQDRIEEAVETFGRVNVDKIATRMQYDYCAAYLEMFKDEPKKARAIATAYQFHPVDRWRNAFAGVIAQIDEIEGKGGKVIDKDDRNQNQGGLAATEPNVELVVNAEGVNLTYQNIDTVRVNYYLMDVELLFSTSPFVQRAGGQFATIKPNATNLVKLPAARTKHVFPLPAEFQGRNVLVEVTAGGKTRSVPHLASTMTVNMSENYGQLQVTETAGAKSVAKVYVKVYAKLADGSVKFHKDGYTDLRGRFDYSSVNTPERQAIERFAILVLSEDRGAVIRDVAPPQR